MNRIQRRVARYARWGRVCALALLWAGLPACRRETPAPAPPPAPDVVLITLDTTRADHLGCYGYFRDTSPRLDEFARECVVFDRCIVPMATTLPTHLSILTALYPLEHGTLANVRHDGRRFEPSPSLLSYAMVAQEAGYATAACVSATPVKRFTGIDRGFEFFDEPPGIERKAGRTTEVALRWLDEHDARPASKPLFLWVHYYDPHTPHTPPPPFDTWFETDAALEAHLAERRFAERATQLNGEIMVAREAVNLYDGEIRFMDEQLGRLLDALRRRPAWPRTVVAIIGDHGEGLCQHGLPGHGYIWHEHLHVPLLIRAPGLVPRRTAQPISAVDLLPTVLGLMPGLPRGGLPQQASGRDVLATGDADDALFSQQSGRERADQAHPTFALTTAEWKYVYHEGAPDELYQLSVDPFELVNVREQHADVAADLRATLLDRRAEQLERGREIQADTPDRPAPLDPAELERLRSLGYVS